MNKHRTIIIFSFLLLAITAFSFALVQNTGAVFEYEPMEGIPGFEDKTKVKNPDLKVWIESTYKFAMWVVGICALFMITIGGFTYMTSAGNTSKAGVGKQIITDAIIGLILALVAVLLFTVINPGITTVNLQITPAETSTKTPTATGGGAGAAAPTVSSQSSSEAVTSLRSNNNVSIDSDGDCKDASGNVISPNYTLTQAQSGGSVTACNDSCKGGNPPCSQSVSLSTKLLDAINTVGTNNSITIESLTGGEHTSNNSTHYKGTGADIIPSVSKSEWPSIVSQFESAGCSSAQTFCDDGKGESSCSAATHIHITCS